MFKFHPHAIMVFGSIAVLFISLLGYQFGGAFGFLLTACILMIPVSFFIGLAWTIYPWQLALFGCLPGCFFVLWRFLTADSAFDDPINESLYIFLPIVSLVSTYFGGYAGRWFSIKRKRKSLTGK